MEKLVNLYERLEDRKAHAQFNADFAAFKAECPAIKKTEQVAFGAVGSKTQYTLAPLDGICATVDPILQRHGFAYSWDSEVQEGLMRVSCTLTHSAGDSRASSFSCPFTTKAGMSDQQKYASALTYGKRQSLTSVLGLATTDTDTDAALAETIGAEQIADLDSLIDEVGADRARFLKFCGVKNIEAIQSHAYGAAVKALEAKRGG